MNSRTAAALVLIGSIMFGFMGLNTRVLDEYGMPVESVSFFRLLVTVIILGIVMLFIDRKLFKIKLEHFILFLSIGFCKVMMDYTLVQSQKYVTLGFATAMQMIAPVFVIVLAYIFYRQKTTSAGIIGTAVCIVGTVLYSGVLFDGVPISGLGIFDGLICSIVTAGFMMLTKELLNKGYHPMTIIFYAFVIALVFMIPFTDIAQSFAIATDARVWVNIILLGVFCTAIPFVIIAYGQKYIDTLKATIYSTFEIVAAAVVGWIFFDESLDLSNIFGIVLIIVAIVIITRGEVSTEKGPKPSL